MYKKDGHKPSRGQIVKSQKISVFIMLSCWISSSNGNLLSRPNGTQTLIFFKIISLISSYAIIERKVVLSCYHSFESDSTLEINLTKHVKISTLF